MQASTCNGAYLRSLSEILKEFLDSVNIMFTPEGMSASAFDLNNIALINFSIPRDAFDRYICQGNYVACLNMNVLHNVLRAVGATRSALTQRIDPNHLDAMQIKIWNSDTRTEAVNTLKLWCFSTDHLDIPNSTFDFYVEMPSAYLQRHVNYLSSLMNNENNNKRIEVVVDSSGKFDLAVEGEFGSARLKIGSAEAGVKMHEGPADPMSDEFGMPKPEDEVVCDDEGSDDDGSGDEEEEGGEQQASLPAGNKRNRGAAAKVSTKKRAKKVPAFTPPPDRGSVLDEAQEKVENERAAVQRPEVREFFNIKYFKSIAKAASLSPTVLIFIREAFPIIFLYRIGTMGKLCFCLSPAGLQTAAGAKDITVPDAEEIIDDDVDIGETEDDVAAQHAYEEDFVNPQPSMQANS